MMISQHAAGLTAGTCTCSGHCFAAARAEPSLPAAAGRPAAARMLQARSICYDSLQKQMI